MKALYVILACCLLTPSCSWFKSHILKRGEYSPAYLQEDSPLDPPGTAAARAEARAKLLKDGAFAVGSTPEVQKGKAFLFLRNPDHASDPGGRMVETAKAKILACEGLYYFVETDDGQRGFLRESDLVDPVRLASTTELIGNDLLPGFAEGAGVFPEQEAAPIELESNQTLMTDQDGRTVVVARKKSEKSQEFEARKRAIEAGKPLDAAAAPAPPSAPAEAENEPLPEPAGSGN